MKDKAFKNKCCIPPQELVTLATALSIALTNGLNSEEIEALSNFLELLSVQVAVIGAQQQFCKKGETELII